MAFNARKAAQTLAYFAIRNGGNPIEKLKAVKLVYLADRSAIEAHGHPILDESRYSMPHGPVNSDTLDCLNGSFFPFQKGDWDAFVSSGNNKVGLANPVGIDELDELSDCELEVLEAVWERFKGFSAWQLRNWTHDKENVPEWQDPSGSRLPIQLEDIYAAVGVGNVAAAAEEHRSAEQATDFLRSL
ncbi:MAG: Panacea domain-containing protein [Pseudomonadota bacterium]